LNDQEQKLQAAVQQAILNSMQHSGEGINVDVQGGLVRLWGVVDVLAEKRRLEEVVKQVAGVAAVDNSLTVAWENMGDDQGLQLAVQERLEAAQLNLNEIQVQVDSGVVYLYGEVETAAEEALAIQQSEHVPGVKAVFSQIAAGGGEDDATITNAVEQAFSVTETIPAHDVQTITSHGVVTLTGDVVAENIAQEAGQIAARAPGVRRVDNQLAVSPEND